MSEKTSTIIKSTFSNKWENPSGGYTYYYDIELQNGDIGSTGVIHENSPKVQVGSEVVYFINGRKIKITNATSENSTPHKSSSGGNSKGYRKPATQDAFLGYAWSYAKDLVIAGKTMKDMHELNAIARYIYNEIGNMIDNE